MKNLLLTRLKRAALSKSTPLPKLAMFSLIPMLLALASVLCAPITTAAYQYQGPEAELIAILNEERKAQGIPPINIDWELTRLARYKSEEMKNHQLFHHESLIYGNPEQLLDRFQVPYNQVGANIAMGHDTPHQVINAWLNSPGHKANMVAPIFKAAGVGVSLDDNGIPYWTLILVA